MTLTPEDVAAIMAKPKPGKTVAAMADLIARQARVIEAADALAEECSYLSGANSLGDYDPPQVSFGRAVVVDALRALAAYRAARGQK